MKWTYPIDKSECGPRKYPATLSWSSKCQVSPSTGPQTFIVIFRAPTSVITSKSLLAAQNIHRGTARHTETALESLKKENARWTRTYFSLSGRKS